MESDLHQTEKRHNIGRETVNLALACDGCRNGVTKGGLVYLGWQRKKVEDNRGRTSLLFYGWEETRQFSGYYR